MDTNNGLLVGRVGAMTIILGRLRVVGCVLDVLLFFGLLVSGPFRRALNDRILFVRDGNVGIISGQYGFLLVLGDTLRRIGRVIPLD